MNLFYVFIGELLGTMFLIALGNGVVANVVYKKTLGSKGGWITITAGWGFAVFLGVIVANAFGTGGHINPAITFGALAKGDLDSNLGYVPMYLLGQIIGAALGQFLVIIVYWQHANENEPELVRATHSTGPTHKNTVTNFASEFIGTAVLASMAFVLMISFVESTTTIDGGKKVMLDGIMKFVGPITMGLVVFSIGLSLGGTTGYAINPARDLIPRVIYHYTPYKTKTDANWGYAWIPVVAPITAGVTVGLFFRLFK